MRRSGGSACTERSGLEGWDLMDIDGGEKRGLRLTLKRWLCSFREASRSSIKSFSTSSRSEGMIGHMEMNCRGDGEPARNRGGGEAE